MHENVAAIVEAALDRRPADVQELVNLALTDMTYSLVTGLREDIERTMFQPVEEDTVAVEAGGEVYDLPESLVAEILGESEEVRAFLESVGDELTEEQEDELQELSTKTLGSYIHKATRDAEHRKAGIEKNKETESAVWRATDSLGNSHYDRDVNDAGRKLRDAIGAHTKRLQKKVSGFRVGREDGVHRAMDKLDHSSSWTRVKASSRPSQPHGPNEPDRAELKAHQARAKRSKVGADDLRAYVRSKVQPSPAKK